MSIFLDDVVAPRNDDIVATWVVHPTRTAHPHVPPETARKLTAQQLAQAQAALVYAIRYTLYGDGTRSMECVPFTTVDPA